MTASIVEKDRRHRTEITAELGIDLRCIVEDARSRQGMAAGSSPPSRQTAPSHAKIRRKNGKRDSQTDPVDIFSVF